MHRIVLLLLISLAANAATLPVLDPAEQGLQERDNLRVRNRVPLDQLRSCITVSKEGLLLLDFSMLGELVDGSTVSAADIYGSVCAGPWPFESSETDFAFRRFRHCAEITSGKGELKLKRFFKEKYNCENWTNEGSLMLRLDLKLSRNGPDDELATVDLPIRFHLDDMGCWLLPVLIEGPLLCRVDSRNPGTATIAMECDRRARAVVEIRMPGEIFAKYRFVSQGKALRHEMELQDLPVNRDMEYRVLLNEEAVTQWLTIQIPSSFKESIRFMYTGDSREGVGGGDRNYMGVNLDALERITAIGKLQGAEFFLMGGDLINGYTTSPADFDAQLYAWKQAVLGFWRTAPVYPALGNHESLLRVFSGDGIDWLGLDRWPYDEASAEAIFADAFCNPLNGPENSDPALPTYIENVYSMQHGPVLSICFNNNWWYSNIPERFGGCPEGYMLDDQLSWIEQEIARADKDDTIKYIMYYAQEPVFPCGGHVKDAMWYHGNNNVKARKLEKKGLVELGDGVVDVRNRFLRMVCASEKSAAVLGADEHGYYRVKIGPDVPIGNPETDDSDGNGILGDNGDRVSPLEDLPREIWFITSGGGGAPYYAHEDAPWNSWWMRKQQKREGYYYSSQENLLLFDAEPDRISLRVLNGFGEEIDQIESLLP